MVRFPTGATPVSSIHPDASNLHGGNLLPGRRPHATHPLAARALVSAARANHSTRYPNSRVSRSRSYIAPDAPGLTRCCRRAAFTHTGTARRRRFPDGLLIKSHAYHVASAIRAIQFLLPISNNGGLDERHGRSALFQKQMQTCAWRPAPGVHRPYPSRGSLGGHFECSATFPDPTVLDKAFLSDIFFSY
jgi:hypothetical protein